MKLTALILITILSIHVHAEEAGDPRFISDRPGATDDPHTMKAGQFRIESIDSFSCRLSNIKKGSAYALAETFFDLSVA